MVQRWHYNFYIDMYFLWLSAAVEKKSRPLGQWIVKRPFVWWVRKFGCNANYSYLFKLSTHVFKQTQYKGDRHAGNIYWLHSWHLRSTICAYFKSLDLSCLAFFLLQYSQLLQVEMSRILSPIIQHRSHSARNIGQLYKLMVKKHEVLRLQKCKNVFENFPFL